MPFPAFDGGRLLFLVIEKIKGSPVSTRVENVIHSIGFILLILLMLYITFNDMLKLF
ncbi:MAG: site-2 protease family protein [bacterium]|nr:site-2 protease family protein [bacterium]